MSNPDQTRFVMLAADVDRGNAGNGGTHVSRGCERVVLVDHRSLFNQHQSRLHQVLREFPKPGVAVFALDHHKGIVGRLWLAATDEVRTGTIGRHSGVDLYLPHDEELSLRHLLVVVRASPWGQRIRVLDLATPSGFQAEEGGVLRAVDANGTVILRAARYSLFVFPTGVPPPWDLSAKDPWLTLPQRVLLADQRVSERHERPPSQRLAPGETNISYREGPLEPGPEPLLTDGERIEGQLILSLGGTEARLVVGQRALERGIILGRYARCSGDTAVMSHDVSRVHAVVLQFDGMLLLVDAGSTNGVLRGKVEMKCGLFEAGAAYSLGQMKVRWEPTY